MADEAGNDRKQWIEDRLQMLAENFAVAVGGFAVLENSISSVKIADTWSINE
jgi:hypothetical protein